MTKNPLFNEEIYLTLNPEVAKRVLLPKESTLQDTMNLFKSDSM